MFSTDCWMTYLLCHFFLSSSSLFFRSGKYVSCNRSMYSQKYNTFLSNYGFRWIGFDSYLVSVIISEIVVWQISHPFGYNHFDQSCRTVAVILLSSSSFGTFLPIIICIYIYLYNVNLENIECCLYIL